MRRGEKIDHVQPNTNTIFHKKSASPSESGLYSYYRPYCTVLLSFLRAFRPGPAEMHGRCMSTSYPPICHNSGLLATSTCSRGRLRCGPICRIHGLKIIRPLMPVIEAGEDPPRPIDHTLANQELPPVHSLKPFSHKGNTSIPRLLDALESNG